MRVEGSLLGDSLARQAFNKTIPAIVYFAIYFAQNDTKVIYKQKCTHVPVGDFAQSIKVRNSMLLVPLCALDYRL